MKIHDPSETRRTASAHSSSVLAARLHEDPWALTLLERGQLAQSRTRSQALWLPRLRQLVEPPAPDRQFPAFLLDLAPFTRLRDDLGSAQHQTELDTGVADEVQRFVDHYRTWLTALEPENHSPKPDLAPAEPAVPWQQGALPEKILP